MLHFIIAIFIAIVMSHVFNNIYRIHCEKITAHAMKEYSCDPSTCETELLVVEKAWRKYKYIYPSLIVGITILAYTILIPFFGL